MEENPYLALDQTELSVLIHHWTRECRRLQARKDDESHKAWTRAYLRAEYLTSLLQDRPRLEPTV